MIGGARALPAGLAALLLAVAPAGAQPVPTQPASAQPDAETLAAARALIAATDVRGQMRQIMPRLAGPMLDMIHQRYGATMPAALRSQLDAATTRFIGSIDTAFTPAMLDAIAAVYARHMSAADLRRVAALMADPAMARFRAATPAIAAETVPITIAAMRPQQTAFQAEVAQILRDWAASHPEEARTPAPGVARPGEKK
ncbi:DUF2059 domain-containing protein [Sphingomonas morindae]|uniref:DUF2059 domain-containing protein n=1 Tax=Sphingomonas morindae TaxID=1541170 RepID=A0ABY4XAR2_9SPHN|nr:DUF2059 domain-containing protein [Sphingomonas morindae]USI74052.1 DUF2059 domain-containing protein [Sphingomonas morindae]